MPKPKKRDKTKAAIRERALRLLQKDGFEAVTMRALAEACGLSLGAFYYHFRSKEEVVLDLYRSSLAGHEERTRVYLAGQSRPRLAEVMEWVCRDRFREFASFRPALRMLAQRLDPQDPLSPWHESSGDLRGRSIELFAEIAEACLPGGKRARRELGLALWLHHLLVVGFWLFDRSKGEKQTEKVLAQCARLWGTLPALTRVPGVNAALALLLSPLARLDPEGA